MSRLAFAAVAVCWFVPQSFGQTGDRRIEDALAEITLLKRALAEQDRRITDLEKIVKVLNESRGQEPTKSTVLPFSTAWKNVSSWKRVRAGMSSAQVVAILGNPTSTNNFGGFQTLFYQGEVLGSGSVTGTIQLNDDRVWKINVPVF